MMSAGSRLGPYEIVALIGAGGMGEVYRARDTRLDRQVAVKILPESLAGNAQFKIRFQREAKTISQLSHPHICALYDVGENYLVMELLEGQTLADRLAKGPLPLGDVLKFGAQIAQALARAHRAGIVHRDLKPGNIMLTKDGAKLLDFGLAKGELAPTATEQTQQKPITTEGTIVGTFQYMAPEQLEGHEADARTDIFALGAVLYEMATGRRAFEGKTKTSLIAAIVSADPKPISEIQPLTPPALEHVIRKCLEKDPEARWQSAADVAEELRWIGQGGPTRSTESRTTRGLYIGLIITALLMGAALGAYLFSKPRTVPRLVYTQINAPPHTVFDFDGNTAVLSPDGTKIAFVAKPAAGAPSLWVRPLDGVAQPLKGTDNALFPFWSPDSRTLAFFADGKLKRIEAAGGSAESIANAPAPRGGSWGDGVIIFAPMPSSCLFRIPATGGESSQITTLNVVRGDTSHRFPTFLPDGHHFLVFANHTKEGEKNILLGSIDSTETSAVLRSDCGVVFAAPDYVLFVRGGSLRAQRIDLKTFQLTGEPVAVVDSPHVNTSLDFANVSASNDGSIAVVEGPSSSLSTLKFFDKNGKEVGALGGDIDQLDPRFAPDGHAVAISRADSDLVLHIYVVDLRRNVESRLTSGSAVEWGPVWSPDSKSIVFTSFDKRAGDLMIKRVDAGGPPQTLIGGESRRKVASQWSADGRYILYQALSSTPTQWDVEAYSVAEKKIIPIAHGTAQELGAQLSPDGHGWRTARTPRAHRKSTCNAFRSRPRSGKSREEAARCRHGAATVAKSITWHTEAG
jgi:Tol biopolymer transport system component